MFCCCRRSRQRRAACVSSECSRRADRQREQPEARPTNDRPGCFDLYRMLHIPCSMYMRIRWPADIQERAGGPPLQQICERARKPFAALSLPDQGRERRPLTLSVIDLVQSPLLAAWRAPGVSVAAMVVSTVFSKHTDRSFLNPVAVFVSATVCHENTHSPLKLLQALCKRCATMCLVYQEGAGMFVCAASDNAAPLARRARRASRRRSAARARAEVAETQQSPLHRGSLTPT